jgi:hypothetical protein
MAMLDRWAIQADLLQPSANSDNDFVAAIQKLKAFSLIDEEVKKILVLKAASPMSVNQLSDLQRNQNVQHTSSCTTLCSEVVGTSGNSLRMARGSFECRLQTMPIC